MDQDRLVELEIKISHQEVAIEKLKEYVYAQDVAVQKMETALKILKERVEGLLSGDGAIGPPGEKPPHY